MRSATVAPRSRGLWTTLSAWLLFVGGTLATGLIDHTMRMRDGDVRNGGLGDAQYLVMFLLGVAALALAWRGTAGLPIAARGVLVGLQGGAGFFLYAFAAIAYVCGSGIDCF